MTVPTFARPILYPETDGLPIADTTLQFDWVVKITIGLKFLFASDPNVFVAGDLFWYPVEGRPDVRIAPDTLVVFGRPPGRRGSYRQWEEAGIAPQVVFKVLCPSNRFGEMSAKFDFYRRYGVEEYYLYDPDPDRLELSGFLRRDDDLIKIDPMQGHVSSRLRIKFQMAEDGLHLFHPDGREFVTFEEAVLAADQQRKRADQLQAELDRLRRETRG